MHPWRSYILNVVLAPDANALAADETAEDAIADDVNAKAHQPFQLPDRVSSTMQIQKSTMQVQKSTMQVQNLTLQIRNIQSRSTVSEDRKQEFTFDNNVVETSDKQ
jgi:hypothetical protein